MLDAYIKAVDSMRITVSQETIDYINLKMARTTPLELFNKCKEDLSNNKISMNKNMVQGRARDFMEVSKEEQDQIDKEMQYFFLEDKRLKEEYHYLKQILNL